MPGRASTILVLLSVWAAGCRVSHQSLLGEAPALAGDGVRRGVVRVEYADGVSSIHIPRPVEPVGVSDVEFRSAMLTAALHWPMSLKLGRRAPGGRLRLALAGVDATAQPALLQGYARYCEHRSEPGDCHALLDNGRALDEDDLRHIALRVALSQALQLAFQTVRAIEVETISATLLTAISGYVAMWLLPEPISKVVAIAFTAAMIAYVGTDMFWAIRAGFEELKASLETAKTFDDVTAAGERLGQRLGPSTAKLILLVGSFAMGGALSKLPMMKLPGGPGAVANANTQGLVLSHLQSITIVPGSITLAIGASSAGGLLMMGTTPVVGGGGSEPSSGGDRREGSTAANQAAEKAAGLTFTRPQLQHAYKHAGDFGVTGNMSGSTLDAFRAAIEKHVLAPNTRAILGEYRGLKGVTHFLDPKTGLNVIRDASGSFLSGWKLSAQQLHHLLTTGKLGGG